MGEDKVVATNRKARHDYHIEETYEAGIVLTGTEVKSHPRGTGQPRDSFARIEDGEVFLYNMHISPYSHGNRWNHEPTRTRKLLLNEGGDPPADRQGAAAGIDPGALTGLFHAEGPGQGGAGAGPRQEAVG